MKRKILVLALLCLILGGTAPPTLAWNDFGHMLAAYLAYKQLTPQAKARVDELLQKNPQFSDWVSKVPAGTSEADKKMMVFMMAATWADKIKGFHEYSDDGSSGGNRPDGAPSSQNTGYADLLRHRYWHFVDIPFTKDGTTLPDVPTPNAKERIGLFRQVLASSAPDDLKSYDMVWLLHVIGDVHQPLHSTTLASAAHPDGDDGGNKEKICNPSCGQSLHAFWDDALGKSTLLGDVIATGKRVKRAKGSAASEKSESVWVEESFQAAKQSVYTGPVQTGDGPFTLTATYVKNAQTLARKRVALAGARLANLLNDELK